VVSILSVLLLACSYRAAVWKKIAATLGINALLALAEAVVAVIIGIDNYGILARAENEQSIALFLSRIVFWMMILILQRLIPGKNERKFSGKMVVLEIIVFAAMTGELLALCTAPQKSIIFEAAVLLGAEVTVYLMIYLQDCLVELFLQKEQASLIEKEKEYYRREAVMRKEKQELEIQFRHDWKNRLQILQQFAEHENVEQLRQYLSEIEEKNEAYQVFCNTGNLIIDSIINSKLQEAVEKNIAVSADITLPAAFDINADDMDVILGNLLDNAIEACERLEKAGSLQVRLNYESGCVLLHIKNSFDAIIRRDGEKYRTRKEDSHLHGIGLQSVKHTVDKYHGVMEITSSDGQFCVDIMLYL
jgi:signal transduction histidine kinase